MAIGHAGYERAEAQMVGAASGEGQRAPAFEHLMFSGANASNLKEMVHHPQAVESGALGLLRDGAKLIAQMRRATWIRKARDLQSYTHTLSPCGSSRFVTACHRLPGRRVSEPIRRLLGAVASYTIQTIVCGGH